MSRPRYYWYGFVRDTIRHYPNGLNENTDSGRLARTAVKYALDRTAELPDGKMRIDCVNMVLIHNTHTYTGAAMRVHASQSTVKRYIRNFVYMTAEQMGFK